MNRQDDQGEETLPGFGDYRPEVVPEKEGAFQREIAHPLTFFVILQKYYNRAPEQELQWCSKTLCSLFTSVSQVNTCLKYVILQFKVFD